MKVHGVKREWSHPIFCIKKHFCPYCNEQLEKIKPETVVNSKSEEAKNYDFSSVDGFLVGNIKFIRTAFRCNKCDKIYTIKEVKENDIAINRKKNGGITMLNNKILRVFCLLCVVACLISLFSCSKEKSNDAIVTYPEDVSAIADFKCVCSTDHETEFVIENDKAKSLYSYIMKQWKKADETQIDITEQDYIYLSFQDGEPLLILSQESKSEISDTIAVSDEHFYGVFWIHENDYMVYTAMPMTSFQKYYKMPEGTYNKIAEMMTK